MPSLPLFSILLTTHSDPDHLDALLQFIRRSEVRRCEVVLADASDDHHWAATLSERESVIPIRVLPLPAGVSRASALNRAFLHSDGDWIWAPHRADRPSDAVLADLLRKLSTAPASVWLLDAFPPDSPARWIEQLREGSLPLDEQWVFHRELAGDPVEPFAPRLHPYTIPALAFQIGQQKGVDRSDAFFIPERSHLDPVPPAVIQEFLFRMTSKATGPEERQRLLTSLQSLELFDREEESEETQLTRLQALAEENPRRALEETNQVIRQSGETQELLKWKIQLLERLRRHVEAAELKHRLQRTPDKNSPPTGSQSRTPGSEEAVIQTLPAQPTLFSDPTGFPEENKPSTMDPNAGMEQSDDVRKTNLEAGTKAEPDSAEEVELHGESADSESEEKIPTHSDEAQPASVQPEEPLLSVIIPTTAGGRRLLEECLIALTAAWDPNRTELVVIDNASLDDTFDYLRQLEERELFPMQIVTNEQNLGFSRAINQGLERSSGRYVLILHNDLLLEESTIDELLAHMEADDDLAAIGPSVDRCEQPEQCISHTSKLERPLLFTDAIDSCCLMLRGGLGLRMNEAYGPALFDDLDLCRQIEQKDLAIAVATQSRVQHLHRQTTEPMGLWLEPELGWRNEEIYHTRWHHRPDLDVPTNGDLLERIHRTPMPVNPLNPPGYWLDQIEELFSDEVRTELQNRKLSGDDLIRLCELLIVADKRDLLRQMETRIEQQEVPLPVYLIRDLIRYYYQRNIYSRCRLYLENPQARGPWFDLYRLRIQIREKEIDDGPVLLNQLMESYPFHPDLYRLAGELHDIQGNDDERDTFRSLAHQLQPMDGETDIFEIKY
ncbi:MAG: glycosyltransferase family 2 protein [Bacteroidota bacterium]